ncbi:LysR family transcriptional regulator [Oxalobacteraceae bacterium CAVE-383]|nr:LysR family transcriptional regulator [Oxalobacteraceae bacterium CAVE-383]
MDIKELDMNLLTVFDALFETGSVTMASKQLELSQPTVSYGLAKLRESFNDPLFIRIDNKMQPTPRAVIMAPQVKRVLEIVKGDLLNFSGFDPATSAREYTFCMSDIGEVFFLPPLIRRIWQESPLTRLRTVSPPPSALTAALEDGVIDLAVGYFPDLRKGGFYQQQLFESTFVCIADRNNAGIRAKLTLKSYVEAAHVTVHFEGRSHELIDRHLHTMKVARRVVLTVPHFMTLVEIIPQTDLIATVPNEVALQIAKLNDIAIYPLPFEAPAFALKQFWHKRNHDDPANQWLRNLVRSTFQPDGD